MDAIEAALGEAPGPYFLPDFSLVCRTGGCRSRAASACSRVTCPPSPLPTCHYAPASTDSAAMTRSEFYDVEDEQRQWRLKEQNEALFSFRSGEAHPYATRPGRVVQCRTMDEIKAAQREAEAWARRH